MIGQNGMRVQMFERPRGARGILPLIIAGIAGARAVYGAVDANQKKKRQEGYIEDSYRAAKGAAESLNARGLGGVSPIQSAMLGSRAPSTIGEQLGADNEKQFGLEQKDLTQQRDRALQGNTDARTGSYINSAFAAASAGANIYGASRELGEMAAAGAGGANGSIADASTPASSMSPIQRAMMPSIDHSSSWFHGVHGIAPLDHPTSSWNPNNHSTNVAEGQSNAQFNVG
jgi:hypothetical protein